MAYLGLPSSCLTPWGVVRLKFAFFPFFCQAIFAFIGRMENGETVNLPWVKDRPLEGSVKLHVLFQCPDLTVQGLPKRFFLGCVIHHWTQGGITQPRKNFLVGPVHVVDRK